MSALTIESLGLTKEEVTERLVTKLAESLMVAWTVDEDGNEVPGPPTKFQKLLQRAVIQRVDRAVEEIAGRHVLPNVTAYVEGFCLTETNKWGEKTGRSLTFTEYLVQRAEYYLTEKVDFRGKAKGEDYGSSWSPHQTRVSALVHEHLAYSIKTALETALKDLNSRVTEGLLETVKMKLAEALAGLKVKTEIGR